MRYACVVAVVLMGCFFYSLPAHALDRNSVTNKFNWGDDLSETPYTSDCPAGTLNCTQAPPTQFKSTHLPDIKQAIDLSVTACSITSDVYLQTDREAIAQIGYPGKLVSSTHVNNLRRAIEELYRQKSQPPPGYLSGDVTTGTPILKAHINDMRRALDDLVVSCSSPPGAAGCWGNPVDNPLCDGSNICGCYPSSCNDCGAGLPAVSSGTAPCGPIGKTCTISAKYFITDFECIPCGSSRTPLCWAGMSPECDLYPGMSCSNARVCGEYRYSDGSVEYDQYPCDGTAPNTPPTGWSSCGSGDCEPNVTWGGNSCEGIATGSTADGAVYCASCQCSGPFYRSTLTCNNGSWVESSPTSWWCFLGDTRVTLSDGSSKAVTELKEGDEVFGKGQVNRVKSVAVRQTSERIYGFNGGKKFVTGGHPFWTQDGWKAIDPSLTSLEFHSVHTEKLVIGDELWLKDGNRLKIRSIDTEDPGEHTVYSPLVDGDHTYYADGLLVHNKTVTCPESVSISPGPCSGTVCGNGTIESGEQCDDSNTVNGDGCSSTCQTEACLPDFTVTRTFQLPVVRFDSNNPSCCGGYEMCEGLSCVCAGGVSESCWPDGTTYNGGGMPLEVATLVDKAECCSTIAVCGGTGNTTCSCWGGGSAGLCSNGVCDAGETCSNCPGDCGTCAGQTCGNSIREGTEACDLGMAGNGPCPKTCSTLCTANVCAPTATCSDGIQNQGETGVDCGGPCAACSGGVEYGCNFKGLCVQKAGGGYSEPTCNFECETGGSID